jgi:hypothetical protein
VKPHLRYLRYVLLHKLYVFRAGLLVRPLSVAWLWRLLVHDLSKFGRAEWGPYVAMFYGAPLKDIEHNERALAAGCLCSTCQRQIAIVAERKQRQAAFNFAWLHHIHVNPHHWQHWVLHEDSGKTLVLVPDAVIADEMLADWMGAGQKVLARPTMRVCVAETVKWYAANHQRMLLRDPVRQRIEENLMRLSVQFGLVAAALQVRAAEQARASIVIPGR